MRLVRPVPRAEVEGLVRYGNRFARFQEFGRQFPRAVQPGVRNQPINREETSAEISIPLCGCQHLWRVAENIFGFHEPLVCRPGSAGRAEERRGANNTPPSRTQPKPRIIDYS